MSRRGFIFDLDGTLVDNMHIHTEAFVLFAAEHGLPPFDMAMRHRIDGKRNRDIFPILFDRELSSEEIRRYTDQKESMYRELSRGKIRAVAGLFELLNELEAADGRLAIATSAPAENVVHSLHEVHLQDRFTVIIRGDQVPRGKPFPDVFLEAARWVDCRPEECVAFEDAPMGVRAAKAAGMETVALTTSFTDDILRLEAPDHIVPDFRSLHGRWAAVR